MADGVVVYEDGECFLLFFFAILFIGCKLQMVVIVVQKNCNETLVLLLMGNTCFVIFIQGILKNKCLIFKQNAINN